jgi:hypothetical protein
MKHDDGLDPIEGGVDVKTELRLTLLLAVFCVGFVLAVKFVAGWLA